MTEFPETAPLVAMSDQNCFLVTCKDAEGSSSIREKYRAGHLANAEKNWAHFLAAGPIKAPGTEDAVGSMFIVFADTEDDVNALLAEDPYFEHGVYASVEILQLINVMGRFLGGKVWP